MAKSYHLRAQLLQHSRVKYHMRVVAADSLWQRIPRGELAIMTTMNCDRPRATRTSATFVSMTTEPLAMRGACSCGHTRYKLTRAPLFVHCCHCTYCQRETGSAFGLNALIEASEVVLEQGKLERVELPSKSDKGQSVFRCSQCQVALWSHYGAGGDTLSFVRVGTLSDAASITPSIHIYTSTKQPWVRLSSEVPSVDEYYRAKEHWPPESLVRARAMRA